MTLFAVFILSLVVAESSAEVLDYFARADHVREALLLSVFHPGDARSGRPETHCQPIKGSA